MFFHDLFVARRLAAVPFAPARAKFMRLRPHSGEFRPQANPADFQTAVVEQGRQMRFGKVLFFICFVALVARLPAQTSAAGSPGSSAVEIPAVEVSSGYVYLHANAPPGACQCFSLNGGYGSVAVNVPHGIGFIADVSAAHAGNVNGTGQSLTVVDYLFGPRYSWRPTSGRLTPYGQVLLGGSTELSSLAPVENVTAFALSAGGGLNTELSHRFGWNIVEADWLHSQLPNAVNNRQNDLRINSGIIFRF